MMLDEESKSGNRIQLRGSVKSPSKIDNNISASRT
jgi:hypothetical protein